MRLGDGVSGGEDVGDDVVAEARSIFVVGRVAAASGHDHGADRGDCGIENFDIGAGRGDVGTGERDGVARTSGDAFAGAGD